MSDKFRFEACDWKIVTNHTKQLVDVEIIESLNESKPFHFVVF